jgi:hypothetical protein
MDGVARPELNNPPSDGTGMYLLGRLARDEGGRSERCRQMPPPVNHVATEGERRDNPARSKQ